MDDDDDDDKKIKEKYDKLFTSFISRKSISINASDLKNNNIEVSGNKEKKKEKSKQLIIYDDNGNNNNNKKRKVLEHSLNDEEIEKIRDGHKKCYIRKICEYIEKDNEDDRKILQDCMNKIVECLKKDQTLPIDPDGKCQNDAERVDEMFAAITEEITEDNFSDNLILKRLWFWLAIGYLSPSFRSFLCPVNSQPLVDVQKFTDFVDEKKNTEFFTNINIYNASRINEVQFIVRCYKLWLDTNPDANIDVYKGTNALQISDEHLIVSGKHSQITDKNRASSLFLLPAPEPIKKSHNSTTTTTTNNNNKDEQKKKEKEKTKEKKEKKKEKEKEKQNISMYLTTISDS